MLEAARRAGNGRDADASRSHDCQQNGEYEVLARSAMKERFAAALRRFARKMEQFVATKEGDWTIKGLIDVDKNLYPISLDTKLVSKILEIHLFPELHRFAEAEGYRVVLAEHQNWYPDISFVNLADPDVKYAVDIKTTYRDNQYPEHVNGFTLGSHGAYFRNRISTKNIQFPYGMYRGHYCLGIIYSRVEGIPAVVAPLRVVDDLRSITSVIRDFKFFAREKWEIASDRQGSGNTANIGSITAIDDIVHGRGVFSKLGEDWFDEYWMNYGLTTMKRGNEVFPVNRLIDFVDFKGGEKDLVVPIRRKRGRREVQR